MKLFVTDRGIGRLDGEVLALLDVPWRELGAVLAADALPALERATVRERLPVADTVWRPLVARPGRFVIAGLNYRAHCEEIGRPVPERLLFGLAPGSAVHVSGAPVSLPAAAPAEVDYEGEIGIVIGRRAQAVSAANAWSCVAGITPLNDVSARDVQAQGSREAVGRAKGFPTFKPMGPCFATPDELADPDDISLVTRVNGEVRQQGRSSDMVFPVSAIIEAVTRVQTLEPGDVICTGTPGGVAHGGRYPYLIDGDRVEVTLDDLPPLVNEFSGSG